MIRPNCRKTKSMIPISSSTICAYENLHHVQWTLVRLEKQKEKTVTRMHIFPKDTNIKLTKSQPSHFGNRGTSQHRHCCAHFMGHTLWLSTNRINEVLTLIVIFLDGCTHNLQLKLVDKKYIMFVHRTVMKCYFALVSAHSLTATDSQQMNMFISLVWRPFLLNGYTFVFRSQFNPASDSGFCF